MYDILIYTNLVFDKNIPVLLVNLMHDIYKYNFLLSNENNSSY